MLVFAVLILLQVGPTFSRRAFHQDSQVGVIPLNMSFDSVDDMYDGCRDDMMNQVNNRYLPDEINQNHLFRKDWIRTGKCMNRSRNNEDNLTEDHLRAICAYTFGTTLYQKFNEAVRTQKNIYSSSSFEFHALHFLLTDSIKLLKLRQPACHSTLRRTNLNYTGQIADIIRFGQFASTSFLKNLTTFGRITCFAIETCFGAYLKSYPHLKMREKEVLVPPYEMFRITGVLYDDDDLDCEVLYKLESAGFHSNMNCRASGNDVMIYG